MDECGIFGVFCPVLRDLTKLVAMFQALPRDQDAEEWEDVNELMIIRREVGEVVELVHEDGQLGVVLSIRPRDLTREQRKWMERHGLEELRGERYFDYGTEKEEMETGPYNRYPVSKEEAAQLLLEILSGFASIPDDERLLATTISNPDEWPVRDPDDWQADSPELRP